MRSLTKLICILTFCSQAFTLAVSLAPRSDDESPESSAQSKVATVGTSSKQPDTLVAGMEKLSTGNGSPGQASSSQDLDGPIQITPEMEALPGLKKGTGHRELFDLCIEWEADVWKASRSEQAKPNVFVFYSNIGKDKKYTDKMQEFMAAIKAGKHPELGAGASQPLVPTYTHFLYPQDKRRALFNRMQPLMIKRGIDGKVMARMRHFVSWAFAVRAAQHGVAVPLLLHESEPTNVPRGRMWEGMEAWPVTSAASKVPAVYRYSIEDPAKEPKKVWARGDEPLGKKPDFVRLIDEHKAA